MNRIAATTLSLLLASFAVVGSAAAQTTKSQQSRRYTVFVTSVKVTKTKASGHAWDNNIFANAPDLRVEVRRRDPLVERGIATLQRQEMVRRSQIMRQQMGNQQARRNRAAAGRRGGRPNPAGRANVPQQPSFDDLGAWQEAELTDPQLIRIQGELTRLRNRIVRNTQVAENTFQAEYGLRYGEPTLDVAAGDTIKLTVWDDDIVVHDVVGATTLRITKEAIARGRFDVQCGKVISLKFEIRLKDGGAGTVAERGPS